MIIGDVEYVTPADFTESAGVSLSMVYDWRRSGLLPGARKVAGRLWVPLEELLVAERDTRAVGRPRAET